MAVYIDNRKAHFNYEIIDTFEAGIKLKGFEVKVWHGMYAPKGTPAPVLTQINTAMRAAMAEPSIVQRLGELSSEIPSADKMTAKGLEDHLKAEINKWGPVIRKAGVTAD
jgi:tripartite-type tricarboxylate transporter receptor subunit TctC